MARRPRLVIPGQAMHVIQRGNNRQAVFFADEDYRVYLDALKEMSDRYECHVHAYVLMTNHVHLLITPHDEIGLSLCMQGVGRKFVRYVNGVYKRSGTLWEGRFKSAVIDTDHYLLRCYRYIEMNPVRAGIVAKPNEYKWSSFHANALNAKDDLVIEHEEYLKLGKTKEDRALSYFDLFKCSLGLEDINAIRDGTISNNVIGNNRFKEEIEKMTKIRVKKLTHGGDRKSKSFRCDV